MRVPLATAAAIGGVKPGTVLKWVTRGHIGRYPDDGTGEFETSEILLWLDQTRDVGKVISAMHRQHQRKMAS